MLNYVFHVIKDILELKPKRIIMEDLKIEEMLQNKALSKYIQKANWGKIKGILTYKCNWKGIEIVFADTFYPSSKTCNRCKYKVKELPYWVETLKCPNCELEIDRDLNAAINLANYRA